VCDKVQLTVRALQAKLTDVIAKADNIRILDAPVYVEGCDCDGEAFDVTVAERRDGSLFVTIEREK
jgi:hypothetical protein